MYAPLLILSDTSKIYHYTDDKVVDENNRIITGMSIRTLCGHRTVSTVFRVFIVLPINYLNCKKCLEIYNSRNKK